MNYKGSRHRDRVTFEVEGGIGEALPASPSTGDRPPMAA